MERMINAHYFMLPTQGNIYSFSVLNLCSGVNKCIVASLRKKIFSFGYCENSEGILKPTVKEISCTYIPSGAEIISVDTFNKSKTCDDFQIGITIAKMNSEGIPETYLNIYSEQDIDNNYVFNIDNIAQNCLMIELSFIPYHLTHSHVLHNSVPKETVWLLSGSDCKIHVYREDAQNHSYNETDLTECFPELSNIPSNAMWLDVSYLHNFTRRISVVGCECGVVQLYVVNSTTNIVISTSSDVFDGPISQVVLFYLRSQDIHPPQHFQNKDEIEEKSSFNGRNALHLLVCNTLQASVVYMDVEEKGLSDKHTLKGSEMYDACLCGCAADLNMDGYNELLLGTYGQEILAYRWSIEREAWEMCGKRKTANPIHSLCCVDLIGDGVHELVVQTLSGIHILQHKPDDMYDIFLARLRKLCGKNETEESGDRLVLKSVPETESCPCEEAHERSLTGE